MKKAREHFVTCGQMKILEQRADADGLSYYQMMENAGTRAAEMIIQKFASGGGSILDPAGAVCDTSGKYKVAEKNMSDSMYQTAGNAKKAIHDNIASAGAGSVLVLCGKGNNGGDGFVVARRMHEAGFDVSVVLVDGQPVTEDSIINLGLIRDKVEIMDMKVDERALMNLGESPDIIIDAIYGTGFRGELSGNGLKAAIFINKQHEEKGTRVAALDIPSGLGGDMTSEKDLSRNSVRADLTITFHARKPVHLQKFAAQYCSETVVADIGIDEERLWNVEF